VQRYDGGNEIYLGQESGTYLSFEEWKQQQRASQTSQRSQDYKFLDDTIKNIEQEATTLTYQKKDY